MKELKISYLKLDLDCKIINHNDDFGQLFNLEPLHDEIINQPLKNIDTLKISFPAKFFKLLNKMDSDDTQSLILVKNNRINDADEDNALLFIYAAITRHDEGYSIRMVNWLNWIHGIHQSLNRGYSFVSGLSAAVPQSDFAQLSDASCFKALYPLITHVPNKFSNSISQAVLFDIMHLFIKQRNGNKCTKDYSRNVYSRLRTNLKKEFKLDDINVAEFIKNEELMMINYNDNIQIPNTAIVKNIVQVVSHDQLLLSVIDAVQPS